MNRLGACLAALVAIALAVGSALSGEPARAALSCTLARATSTPPPVPTIPTIGPVDPKCGANADQDVDGWYDFEDNCPTYFNPDQADLDEDSGPYPYPPPRVSTRDPSTGGDVCDTDDDSDGLLDVNDNCPRKANTDQADRDHDGLGDACDPQPDAAAAGSAGFTPLGKLSVALELPRSERLDEIRAGVAVGVRCTAACSLRGELRLRHKTVARAGGGLTSAGRTFLFLRLSRATLSRLAHSGGGAAKVDVTASDARGHSTAAHRSLRLVRPRR